MKNLDCVNEYLKRECLIQDIIKYFERRYGDLMDKADKDATNTVKKIAESDKL